MLLLSCVKEFLTANFSAGTSPAKGSKEPPQRSYCHRSSAAGAAQELAITTVTKLWRFLPQGTPQIARCKAPPGRSHFAGVTTSWRRTTQPPAASLRAVTTGRERGPPHPQHHRTWQGEDGEQELQRLSEEQPRFWVLSTPARTGSPPPCHPTRKTCAAGTAQGLDPGSHGHPSKAQAVQTCPATTAKSFLPPDVFYCPTEGNPYF